MALNPKLKDFIEENPNKTMVGFMWSLWWRFVFCVYGTVAIVTLIILGLTSLHPNTGQNAYTQTSDYQPTNSYLNSTQ